MTIPDLSNPNAAQYNKDLTQYAKDLWMMNPANPKSWPAQWNDLIQELKNLKGTGRAGVEKAMRIIQFKLLGPTLIDGYYQGYGKVRGDLMNLTADVGSMVNQVSSIFSAAKNGEISVAQALELNNAMTSLYAVYATQKGTATINIDGKDVSANWMTKNGAQNGLNFVTGLYTAMGATPGYLISQTVINKTMVQWWKIDTKNPTLPNPNLKIFQDNLQSLSGINNSISQSATTQQSLNNSNMNSMMAVLKSIFTSLTNLESKMNQSMAKS